MEEIIELRVKNIIPETADASTYVLEEVNRNTIPYQSGQFLTLLIRRGTKELRRSYSLSSAPGIDPDLTITIKRVTNGEVSRYLLDTLQVGDILRSLPPAGRFTLQTGSQQQRDIFLFAAGSGITPLFSILKAVLQHEPRSRVTLINSNKDRKSTLYADALDDLQAKYPDQFQLISLFSEPSPEWSHYRGRLENSRLERLIRENLHYERERAVFYTCGPMPYMRLIRITLVFMGFDPEQIRKENFVTEPLFHATALPPLDSTPRRVTIAYRNAAQTFEMPANQTLLQGALDHQIPLPYSCRGGACATCVGRCTQGEVRMTVNDVLTDREIADGWVLTCVGYPVTEAVRVEL